jgi:hypothetical protein
MSCKGVPPTIHLTREYRASLDLDPRPTAMRLPQVTNAMALLPIVSERVFQHTSPFCLVCPIHCDQKKSYRV